MRNSFTFYGSYFDAVSKLPVEEQGEFYRQLINYAMLEIEPQFDGVSAIIWPLVKPNIEKSIRQYKNGSQIKATAEPLESQIKATQKPSGSQTEAKSEPDGIQITATQKPTKIWLDNIKDKEREIESRIKNEESREKNKEERKLSLSQQKFHKAFPNKAIDDEFPIDDNNLVDDLIEEIKKSDFLVKCDNLGFHWCIDHMNKILDGAYRDFKPKDQMLKHRYSAGELNALFDSLDEIEA